MLRVRRGESSEQELVFAVEDTGPGITAEDQLRLFQPFTQIDSSRGRRHGGTGLGLSLSRRLAELMGGSVRMESTPGKGSTFSCALPLPSVPPGTSVTTTHAGAHVAPTWTEGQVNHAQASASETSPSTRRLRILHADDSADNRFLVDRFVSPSGHVLVVAEDGESGLERFQHELFDVVLMDMQLPGMDGCAVIEAMRAWERDHGLDRVPILALTADAMTEDRERCLAAGADDHLPKPMSKRDLLQAIERVSTERKRQDSHRLLEEVRQLLPAFVERRRRDLATLLCALDQRDFGTVRALGHDMRGTGTSYGQPVVTRIGTVLEQAANREDTDSARAQVAALTEWLTGFRS